MQPVVNVEDIRQIEKHLATVGVSVSELMHRAGRAVAEEVINLSNVQKVTVVCGVGNNGGDGWVAASYLKQQGFDVEVVTAVSPSDISSDLARVVAAGVQKEGMPIRIAPSREELEELLDSSDVVIDAILGTGFRGSPATPFDIWIDTINMSGCQVISVDVPSGLNAQTGHTAGPCIQADVTVTMLALKPGLLADEARDVCGSIIVTPLAEQTEELVFEADPVAWRTAAADYVDIIAAPTFAQNKYTRGTVLVVAGSSAYPGAAIMCAKAANRSGAGYVKLAVPAPMVPICQMHLIDIPVVGLPSDDKGYFSEEAARVAVKLAKQASVTVVGPGMGSNAASSAIVTALLESSAPLVIDADGLNAIARITMNRLDKFPELIRRSSPLILTPHAGELGRLMGLVDTPPNSLVSCMEAARRIVWSNGGSECVVVAKGTQTACVGVEEALLPKAGPASLATAGTGDILSGIIAGLLAHNSVSTEALPLLCSYACEVQGVAASIAAKRYGSQGVCAPDIIEEIGSSIDALIARCMTSLGLDPEDEQ